MTFCSVYVRSSDLFFHFAKVKRNIGSTSKYSTGATISTTRLLAICSTKCVALQRSKSFNMTIYKSARGLCIAPSGVAGSETLQSRRQGRISVEFSRAGAPRRLCRADLSSARSIKKFSICSKTGCTYNTYLKLSVPHLIKTHRNSSS